MTRPVKRLYSKAEAIVDLVRRMEGGELVDEKTLLIEYGISQRTWRRWAAQLVEWGLPVRRRTHRQRRVVEWVGTRG